MKAGSSQAFVLRTGGLGESDVLVTLFTRDQGKLRGVARGGRRSRKRFGGAFEPLTRVQVTFVAREGRELVQIRDLEVLRSYFEMQAEPVVAAACAYFCEVVDQFGREGETDELFFRLVGACLDGLDSGVDPFLAARYFELWTCRTQGLLPDLRNCAACERPLKEGARYEPKHSDLHCLSCGTGEGEDVRISGEALALAGSMLSSTLEAVSELRVEQGAVKGLGRFVATILTHFVERPFVSRKFMEEMSR